MYLFIGINVYCIFFLYLSFPPNFEIYICVYIEP